MVFSVDIYRNRINNAVRLLKIFGGDYILVTPSPNLIYFTGIREETYERIMFLVANADGEVALVAPQLVSLPRHVRDLAEIYLWSDSSGPSQIIERIAKDLRIFGRIGFFEDSMRLSQLDYFREKLSPEKIYLLSKISRELRYKKSHEEIMSIYNSVKITEKILQEIYNIIAPGLTERFLATQIINLISSEGADPAFRPIVAFGENSSEPHHIPGDRVLRVGDLVLVDVGVMNSEGYVSDLTRIFHVGAPSKELRDVYNVYIDCYNEVLRSIRVGAKASELDLVSRVCISDHGYGAYIKHRTGHGIGLEVHEPPYISIDSSDVLEKGVVFTVEPGIYIPNKFGVRVESNIAVSDEGEVLELDKLSREIIIF
ncbi:MAG: M24 family metallopeptidase [Sulfolobales archaeon]